MVALIKQEYRKCLVIDLFFEDILKKINEGVENEDSSNCINLMNETEINPANLNDFFEEVFPNTYLVHCMAHTLDLCVFIYSNFIK
ncbi:hypothetical protein A3Q56_00046 [Intoshia linei]|uniref:Uncharacterized protein n=1 Tax=Intoshia linei TaxID=1819745 RepID=A0A177BCZ2_9BILA|nr:hypothetical protein A3Q56_00046 [Intoshia linei]